MENKRKEKDLSVHNFLKRKFPGSLQIKIKIKITRRKKLCECEYKYKAKGKKPGGNYKAWETKWGRERERVAVNINFRKWKRFSRQPSRRRREKQKQENKREKKQRKQTWGKNKDDPRLQKSL